MIRPGWKVVSSDGQQVGQVDEVTGDDTHDIFDGLAISATLLGAPRYVPAEQVGPIEEGIVHLTIPAAQLSGLGEFREPAVQEQIEPDDHRGIGASIGADVRGVESWMSPPRGEHAVGLWGRIKFAIRRFRGS